MAHVFLVDDDADFIEVNKMVLEAHGHEVTVAYSGQECWDLLQKGQPDVVILDCMMEEFNSGFDVANDISIKFPKLPVVMLTSVHNFMSDKWQYSKEGDGDWLPVHTFVEKPVAPNDLVATIEKVLKEAK